jgi:thiol-disulfide isomerase/thioredoxin
MAAPVAFAASDKVGTDAPPFKVAMLEGGELDLEESLGKKVIMLDFWSIYCVSCVQEMPYLVAIQNKYADDLLTVGVDLDSFGSKRVKKFVNKLKFELSYPIVVDKRRKVAALYSVSVLPTTVIIDKKGKTTFYHVGFKPGDEVDNENHIKAAIADGQ